MCAFPPRDPAAPPPRRGWGPGPAAARVRATLRLAALAATAAALLGTSVPPCLREDRGTFQAAGTCGPPGVVTLVYEGARYGPMCGGGDGCWAFLEARGGRAAGLPEQGEIHPAPDSSLDPVLDASTATGRAFFAFPFALVGDAPVAGASPPATVRRICQAAASPTLGVVEVRCVGDAPGAPCSASLTLVPEPP